MLFPQLSAVVPVRTEPYGSAQSPCILDIWIRTFLHICVRLCGCVRSAYVIETHFCGTRVRVARCHADALLTRTLPCAVWMCRTTSMNISHGGYTTAPLTAWSASFCSATTTLSSTASSTGVITCSTEAAESQRQNLVDVTAHHCRAMK